MPSPITFRYLGHSCFLIEHDGHRLLTDPFLTGNPKAACKPEDVVCDTILASHGHGDHIGDLEGIAKRNNALVVSVHEISEYFGARGCRTHGMYHGGRHDFAFGRVKLVPAIHGSGMEQSDGTTLYMGNPAGFVITLGGRNVYFAGDTCVFSDMQLIARLTPIDIAMIPVGDNYTMGPDEALVALEFLKPKACIPMHYNTWPLIGIDAPAFARAAAAQGVPVHVIDPGAAVTL